MDVIALQSGSNGNCIYVEACGVRLLVDAGISGVQAQRRLEEAGCDIDSVDGVIITHDHADHASALGIYQRKFRLPVHVTPPTLEAAKANHGLGKLPLVHPFVAGATLQFGPVSVHTFPTPHDAADGVALVVDDGRFRLGILTDLGHVFGELESVVRSLDGVLLESNYDPALLAEGRYPEHLKRRIRGPAGHLSNQESAELLARAASGRLQWVCLAHLSEENNRPELALQAHRQVLGDGLSLHVASRYRASGRLGLGTDAEEETEFVLRP